jgi:hypothetical protein
VGENGQNSMSDPMSAAEAIDNFKKKFQVRAGLGWRALPAGTRRAPQGAAWRRLQDKTKNKWDTRDNFVAHAGKYTLLDMADDAGDDGAGGASAQVALPPRGAGRPALTPHTHRSRAPPAARPR